MKEILTDRVEIDGLVGLDNKRRHLARTREQLDAFTAQQQLPSIGDNGAVPSGAATTDDGIMNRCPVTNNYYQAPAQPTTPSAQPTTPVAQPTATPTPTAGSKLPSWLIPAGIALLLATGAGGAAWWLATRPTPPSSSTPGTPAKLPTYSPDTTIKFS